MPRFSNHNSSTTVDRKTSLKTQSGLEKLNWFGKNKPQIKFEPQQLH